MHILTIDLLIFHFFVKRITVLSSLSIIKPDLPGLKTQFYRPGNPYNQENSKQLYLSSISVTELSFLTTKVSKGQ